MVELPTFLQGMTMILLSNPRGNPACIRRQSTSGNFPGHRPQAFPLRKGCVPELNSGVGMVGGGQCFPQPQASPVLRADTHNEHSCPPRPQLHAVF